MKKIFIRTIFFIIFTIFSAGVAYADQVQSNKKTYIVHVTSEKQNQQINFMVSYLRANNEGEIAHYQMTQSTPWEVEITADQLYALFNSSTDNNMLNVEISLKTKEGKQFLNSATGHGIVATEGPGTNGSIIGL
jgi:hypothetical protein